MFSIVSRILKKPQPSYVRTLFLRDEDQRNNSKDGFGCHWSLERYGIF